MKKNGKIGLGAAFALLRIYREKEYNDLPSENDERIVISNLQKAADSGNQLAGYALETIKARIAEILYQGLNRSFGREIEKIVLEDAGLDEERKEVSREARHIVIRNFRYRAQDTFRGGNYGLFFERSELDKEFDAMVAELQKSKPEDSDNAMVAAQKPVVLLADDDQDVFMITGKILKEAGFDVIYAHNGAVALEIAQNRSDIDLVITDLNMPRMDGVELAKELDSLRPELPVILHTSMIQALVRAQSTNVVSVEEKGYLNPARLRELFPSLMERAEKAKEKERDSSDDAMAADVLEERPVVLFVDEDVPNLRSLVRRLKGSGFTVITANDGEEAVRIAGERDDISLVITDSEMEKMDAVELAQRLDTVRPELSVIIQSSMPDQVKGQSPNILSVVNKSEFGALTLVDSVKKFVGMAEKRGSSDNVRQAPDALGETSSPDSEKSGDRAMAAAVPEKGPVGGIDLNPALLDMQIKRDGLGVPLPISDQPIENMNIGGFIPIIINVTPVVDLPLIMGFKDTNEGKDDISKNRTLDPMDRNEISKAIKREQVAILN